MMEKALIQDMVGFHNRNTLLTEEQLLSYLKEAQLSIEEFDAFIVASTMVGESKVEYKMY